MDGNGNNEQNNNGYTSYTPNNYNGPVVVSNAIPEKNGGCAVASLVLGILSLLGFFTTVPGMVCGLIGIILGIINLAKGNPQKGMAIAGIVLSVLGFLLGGAVLILYIAAVASGL